MTVVRAKILSFAKITSENVYIETLISFLGQLFQCNYCGMYDGSNVFTFLILCVCVQVTNLITAYTYTLILAPKHVCMNMY